MPFDGSGLKAHDEIPSSASPREALERHSSGLRPRNQRISTKRAHVPLQIGLGRVVDSSTTRITTNRAQGNLEDQAKQCPLDERRGKTRETASTLIRNQSRTERTPAADRHACIAQASTLAVPFSMAFGVQCIHSRIGE